jgi:quinol monooxygenase YgiN
MANGEDMVIATLRFLPAPKQHSQVLEVLRSVLGPTETQPGCLSCRIYEEHGPDAAIMYCESWETEAAMQAHIRSDLYLRVLAAFELSRSEPEVCFHEISSTHGLELVHQLRGSTGGAGQEASQT